MPSTTPARPRLSLAGRLTLTYAGSSCLLLLLAAGLMYYQLVASLRQETASYLNGEIREARSDLAQPLATEMVIRHEVENDSPSEGDLFPTYLRVLNPAGNVVAETDGMSALVPSNGFPAAPSDPESTGNWMTTRSMAADQHRFEVGSAMVVVGATGTHYVLQLALDLSEEDNLLEHYRIRMWTIFAPALLAAVVAGYVLAHNGLRPLRQVIRSVRRVQTTTLDQRIDSSGFPADIAKLADSFNEAVGRIEDAFRRLSQFSSDIAHELRTPLGCIRGELEVALGKARTSEEYREVLGSCLEESVRLGHLIDRLLFLAKAERQETTLRLETVNVGHEIQTIRDFYEAAAAENGITLSVESDSGLQARLDRTLLQSALGNLLENAITHTPRGGSVKLTATNGTGTLRLQVSDTGSGIAPEHMPFVLDRFYRTDNARSRQGGHLGLGLAIVKSIANLHGGQVQIESKLGAGTRVALVLPLS